MIEIYVIQSYRPIRQGFNCSDEAYKKTCCKIANNGNIKVIADTAHGYYWRCQPASVNSKIVKISGSNYMFDYDVANRVIIDESFMTVKYLILMAKYGKLELRLNTKDTIVLYESKEVWKSSSLVVRRGVATCHGHCAFFLTNDRTLLKFDFRAFLKSLAADTLSQADLFVSKVNSRVMNISGTTDKPANVYYFKYGGNSKFDVYRNNKKLFSDKLALDKTAPISYFKGYIAVAYFYSNYAANSKHAEVRLYNANTWTRLYSLAANHVSDIHAEYHCSTIKLSMTSVRGVIFVVSVIDRHHDMCMLAYRRGRLSSIVRINLSSMIDIDLYSISRFNTMTIVNDIDHSISILMICRQSIISYRCLTN